MKKRLIIFTLIFAMIFASASSAFAAVEFSDITESTTATAVEVLKLMGVVSGNGDGTFAPNGHLTRAEFCKMAVVSMGSDADMSKYSNLTIFPDVKPSKWYFSYVNMASKGLSIIYGFPDGTFSPDDEITAGQAVTILLRLIGFTDAEVGGVWPYAQMSVAESIGMLSGIRFDNASSCITRSQAAKLFVNMMTADSKEKGRVYSLSEETVLKSVAASTKTMHTSGGSYKMARASNGTNLIGKTGYVVFSGGKAISFIPKSVIANSSDTAVVIKTAGDRSVLDALAGRSDYTIYKNGSRISASDLKSSDVAVYDAAENRINVSDTKLTVLYESCTPSPAAPSVITALGGMTFDVLPSAASSMSKFKPGQTISIYLTSDGRVAGAGSGSYSGSQNNAVFIANQNGELKLVCADEAIDLPLSVSSSSQFGKALKLNHVSDGNLSFAVLNGSYGSVDAANGLLGGKKITSNALIFLNGERAGLADISKARITYARENTKGEYDLIVSYDNSIGTLVAGKATVEAVSEYDSFGENTVYYMTLTSQNGSIRQKVNYGSSIDAYVVASNNGEKFSNVKQLSHLADAAKSDFDGDNLVHTQQGSLAVFDGVACYNRDTKKWSGLQEALAYGRNFALYGQGTTVYVIEYSY